MDMKHIPSTAFQKNSLQQKQKTLLWLDIISQDLIEKLKDTASL